jgi:predicted membrane channel-forming protein YqfA (hemolysin III family)
MVHIGWLPFLSSDSAKRITFVVLGICFALIGVGLWRRSKIAWYGVFAYVGLGNLLLVLGWFFDPAAADEVSFVRLVVTGVTGLVIAVGIYAATSPTFQDSMALRARDGRGVEAQG